MAKLNLNDFKKNAKRAITDKPDVGGIFSEPNQRTFSLPLDSLFYRIKIRLGNPSIRTLTGALERFGQIEPIIVHKIDEGYEIINGHQRVLALSMLGRSDVVATLHDANDTEALFLPYLLNADQSFSPREIANYLRTLTMDYGLAPQLIEEQTGLKSSQYERLQSNQDLNAIFDEQPTYDEAMAAINTRHEESMGKRFHLREKGFRVEKSGQKIRIDADEKQLDNKDISELYRLIDFIRLRDA